MKKLSQSSLRPCMFVVLAISLLGSVAVAQSTTKPDAEKATAENTKPAVEQEAEQANAKLVGTWCLDLEKSKEFMSEDSFEMVSEMLGDSDLKMVFGADNNFTMTAPGMPKNDATYTCEAVEGEENAFNVVVTGPQMPDRKAKLILLDENTVKFMPEGEEPAVLVRQAEEEAEAENSEAEVPAGSGAKAPTVRDAAPAGSGSR